MGPRASTESKEEEQEGKLCVCVTMKKSARRMASTTIASDAGDTASKQQQAQCKQKYNKSKRPVSSVDHCHPYRRKKEKHYMASNFQHRAGCKDGTGTFCC